MPRRGSTGRIQLKPTQERALAAMQGMGSAPLTRGRYEELAGVSRSQAAYDLAELVEAGILERIGGGRSTRYRLAVKERPGRRHWTNDRIRTALEEFCSGRKTWPSASAFRGAGRSDLYVAASRYGGIAFWARELGLTRSDEAAPRAKVRRRRRPSLRWAGAAAVAATLLVTLGGARLQEQQGGTEQLSVAAPTADFLRQLARRSPDARRAQAPARRAERPRVSRRASSATRRGPEGQSTGRSDSNQLAVQRGTPRTTLSATPAASSGGPPPLPSPSGGGASTPQPLPSP